MAGLRQQLEQREREILAPQAAKFTAVNALALLQTLVVSLVLARWLQPWVGEQQAQALAHLAGVAVPVFTSFLGHRHATFRKS